MLSSETAPAAVNNCKFVKFVNMHVLPLSGTVWINIIGILSLMCLSTVSQDRVQFWEAL